MPRERVTGSKSIAAIGYDPPDVLEVEFVSGDRYRYQGVSHATFREFREAPSKGTFFLENIRDVYAYERMT